jgi:hypothetical protein
MKSGDYHTNCKKYQGTVIDPFNSGFWSNEEINNVVTL